MIRFLMRIFGFYRRDLKRIKMIESHFPFRDERMDRFEDELKAIVHSAKMYPHLRIHDDYWHSSSFRSGNRKTKEDQRNEARALGYEYAYSFQNKDELWIKKG